MKKISLSIILIFQISCFLVAQDNLKIRIKQHDKLIEMKDGSFNINREPFEFEIDISDQQPSEKYEYNILYVSTIKESSFEKYKKIDNFFNIPQYHYANNLPIDKNNSDKYIYVTETTPSNGFGLLIHGNYLGSSFYDCRFIDNALKCKLMVDSVYYKRSISINKFRKDRIFFYFSYENENLYFSIDFID